MAVADFLFQNSTYKYAIDNWYDLLSQAAESKNNIDLSIYENAISSDISRFLGGRPSTVNTSIKTFPIVFHFIVDDPSLIRGREDSGKFQFKVNILLQRINEVFKTANIKFCPAVINNSPLAGVNIVNGSNIVSRIQLPNGEVRTVSYAEFGAKVNNSMSWYTRDSGKKSVIDKQDVIGVPLNTIHDIAYNQIYKSKDQRAGKSAINVFLINTFSENLYGGHISCVSNNPFIFDNGDKEEFSITLPFWALGDSGLGYAYRGKDKVHTEVRRSTIEIEEGIGAVNPAIAYYGARIHPAKPLLKGLGHAFGLANLNTFNQFETSIGIGNILQAGLDNIDDSYYTDSCNNNCVYYDFTKKDFCADCSPDSSPTIYYNTIIEGGLLDAEYCIDTTVYNDDNFKATRTNNVMSDTIYSDVLNMRYGFTPNQALRMHANIGLNYLDDKGNIYGGVLNHILNHGLPSKCTSIDDNFFDVDDPITDPALLCDDKTRRDQDITGSLYIYDSNFNTSTRAINMSDTVSKINNITDNFI